MIYLVTQTWQRFVEVEAEDETEARDKGLMEIDDVAWEEDLDVEEIGDE